MELNYRKALNDTTLYASILVLDAFLKQIYAQLLKALIGTVTAGAQHYAQQELQKSIENDFHKEGASVLGRASQGLNQVAQLLFKGDDSDVDMKSLEDLMKHIGQAKASFQEYKELPATVLVRYEHLWKCMKAKNGKPQGASNADLRFQTLETRERDFTINTDGRLVNTASAVMIGAQQLPLA